MNEAEKERLIKKDIVSIENRVRHAFNQGYEMGLRESRSEIPNTCGDAISRQAVIDLPRQTIRNHFGGVVGDVVYVEDIKRLPSVTPQQRTGLWIQKEEEGEAEPFIIWECSECHEYQRKQTTFCPDCGAKMRRKNAD